MYRNVFNTISSRRAAIINIPNSNRIYHSISSCVVKISTCINRITADFLETRDFVFFKKRVISNALSIIVLKNGCSIELSSDVRDVIFDIVREIRMDITIIVQERIEIQVNERILFQKMNKTLI